MGYLEQISRYEGGKGGGEITFQENKLVLSQFTGHSTFTKTKWHVLTRAYVTCDI